jgi:hypothetical protein
VQILGDVGVDVTRGIFAVGEAAEERPEAAHEMGAGLDDPAEVV